MCSITNIFPRIHLYGNVFVTHVLAMGLHVTLLPPSGCSSRIAYQCVTIPTFPRSLLVMSHLPSSYLFFFLRWQLSNRSHCSLLKIVCPEKFLDKLQVGPGVQPSFLFSCPNGRGKTIQSGWGSHISGSSLLKLQEGSSSV
jgi:hypothetical protein